MNHRNPPIPGAQSEISHQLSKKFSSDDGCRILSTVLSDECKLLQETKKILEKRILYDEQYAKNLQELAASADRVAWPVTTHPIASVSRETFLQWSTLATTITSNAEQFRKKTVDDSLKELIEQKTDSKKFLDGEKHRYHTEHRKAQSDVVEADKHYIDEAKAYVAKNNELTKLQSNSRKVGDSRLKDLKDLVVEKRGNLYRAHNDYILKLREYSFIDEQYVRKVQKLLVYHEEAQLILNKQWQNLLDAVANYLSYNHGETKTTTEMLRQMILAVDPRHCYDETCKIHANILPLAINPQVFNELLLQTSGLSGLKVNQFIGDNSTKRELKQRIDKLTTNVNEPVAKPVDFVRNKQTSYYGRKNFFEQEQQMDYLRTRKIWEEQLRDEINSKLKDAGYEPGHDSDSDTDIEPSDRLEDQPYFHGVIPRCQSINHLAEKGDYLVRINEQGKIVLSILWTGPDNSNKLKDGHFIIHEAAQMFSLQPNAVSKSSVTELILFYKRQKLELRDDGTRLIRPVARPEYIINNDEVHTGETLGKGHFGQVTRGEYRGQPVAVKILHPSSADRSVRDRQNFVNEALLLRQYKHKNIVKFLGIAAIRDPLMIVMELIEHGSLDKYLKNNELGNSQMIQICYDVAKGMEYLEKLNIIHRDLAARNCLVDKKKNRVKVADFGLSRCLESDDEYFCQLVEVPVRWWAVEVLLKGPYTPKSDVWSYGITAWEVFSKAATPYAHISHNHLVMDAVKRGERLKQPDKCPPKIFTIITQCWDFNPKDRPNFDKVVELLKKEKPYF